MSDDEVKEAFPILFRPAPALGEELTAEHGFGCTPISEHQAHTLGILKPDQHYQITAEELRPKLMTVLKAVGKLRTGKDVDSGWVWSAAVILGRETLGCIDFDIYDETCPAALDAVIVSAEEQLRLLQQKARDKTAQDTPF